MTNQPLAHYTKSQPLIQVFVSYLNELFTIPLLKPSKMQQINNPFLFSGHKLEGFEELSGCFFRVKGCR